MNKVKLSIFIFFSFIGITGCSAGSGDNQKMESIQEKFNKRQSNEILAFMDLKTMFPNKDLRALAEAAGKGNISLVNNLVMQGVDVNARGHRNATALFWAMKSKKGFSELLELGADPNVVFDDGGTVLHWAAGMNDPTYIRLALEHGGDPNLAASVFQVSPIFETINFNTKDRIPDTLKVLIEYNADIEFKDETGDTVLLKAAAFDRFDICLYLLEKGADFKVKNDDGWDLKKTLEWRKTILLPDSQQAKWLYEVEKWIDVAQN